MTYIVWLLKYLVWLFFYQSNTAQGLDVYAGRYEFKAWQTDVFLEYWGHENLFANKGSARFGCTSSYKNIWPLLVIKPV